MNTLYVLYFPLNTYIVQSSGAESCGVFGGYHYNGVNQNKAYAYAVIPDCGDTFFEEGFGDAYNLAGIEAAASHEIAEAATDPGAPAALSYTMSNNQISPWALTPGGGEVGDMCNTSTTHWADADAGYLMQRIWSNTLAQGDGSPCAPVIYGEPFAASSGPSRILNGQAGDTVEVPYQSWSTAPVPDWFVVLEQVAGGGGVTISRSTSPPTTTSRETSRSPSPPAIRAGR